jgi:hypothetical protein
MKHIQIVVAKGSVIRSLEAIEPLAIFLITNGSLYLLLSIACRSGSWLQIEKSTIVIEKVGPIQRMPRLTRALLVI